MPKNQHITTRTCTTCRQALPKRDLLALTKLKSGIVIVNYDQKSAGRSIYVCKKKDCLKSFLKNAKQRTFLKSSLRGNITDEILDEIKSVNDSIKQ